MQKANSLAYLMLILTAVSICLSGCVSPPPKYVIYDASRGAIEKGCVDFYTLHPHSGLKYYATWIRLIDQEGHTKKLGYIGGKHEGKPERLRVVLPCGLNKFEHGASPLFENLEITVPVNKMVPVEVTTTASPSGVVFFGAIGALSSQKNEAKVEAPQAWDPNDHEWTPLK